MGVQFFGEFLIDRWVITRGQLLEALELQDYRNSRFGNIAVGKGFLTEEQVNQIHKRQRQVDRRFGDLAVEMGVLNQDQVRQVLTQQRNDYLYLGESLLELGHVTDDILERELAIFEEEQARFSLEDVAVPGEVAGEKVISACVDLSRKMFLRLAGVLIKVGDAQVFAKGDDPDPAARNYHLTVSVPLVSAAPIRYLLSLSSELAVIIASKILGEDATRESEAIVEDAVKEFCNIVCGNVAAKLAQQGVEVEIGPPESHPTVPQPEDGRLLVSYPIRVADGQLDLRFLAPAAAQ